MKKLFAKLFVLILLSITFFSPAVYAKGNDKPINITLEKNEIVNKDYFAAGDTVTLSGVINGDAYVAGGNVLFDGTINGDLFVAGGMVTIRGKVKNDLRAVGGNITIAGPIIGNVTLAGGNTNISPEGSIGGSLLAGTGNLELFGPVGKGITAGVGNFIINAPVGGDALLGTGQLTLQPKTKIAGNLTYWGEEEAAFQGTATVTGSMTYHEATKSHAKPMPISKDWSKGMAVVFSGFGFVAAGIWLLTMFVLGLILMALLPSFTDKTVAIMQKNLWGSFGLGIVTVIVLPVLGLSAMITIIGIPVGLFLFTALSLLCLVGHVYAAFFIGRWVFTGIKAEAHRAWHLLVGLVILGVLTLIPILGWLAHTIVVFVGIGAMLFEKHAVYGEMRKRRLV